MKRVLLIFMITFLLTGCNRDADDIQPARQLRNKLLSGNGCKFTAQITADYGDSIYTFLMHCQIEQDGVLQFEVVEPESIAGIAGTISGEKGTVAFDDKVLAFDTLADGYISPVSAPWVMMNSLRSGYITSCGKTDGGYQITLNDSYADDALQLDIWIDDVGNPIQCDILYKERRCLTIVVNNYTYL